MVEIEELDNNTNNTNTHAKEGDASCRSNIQLGFSEPLSTDTLQQVGHRSPFWWKDWDGGQLGGRPTWLQPRDIPHLITCQTCGSDDDSQPMQFICQLYVPLDHVPTAFHRSLYIFACPTCCNTRKQQQQQPDTSSSSNTIGNGIRVLRVQLPQDNPFYPQENTDNNEQWKQHLPITWGIHLCQVCGQRATGKCPLQQVWFCGKVHQKEYKKYTAKMNTTSTSTSNETAQYQQQESSNNVVIDINNKDSTSENRFPKVSTINDDDEQEQPNLLSNNADQEQDPENTVITTNACHFPSVYPESELVVDEEPPADNGNDSDNDDDDDDDEIEARPTMFPSSTLPNNEHDSDEDLEQEDLNEMVTGKKSSLDQTKTKDPITSAFYQRIQNRHVPEQCLRYTMEWRRRYDVPPAPQEQQSTAAASDNNHTTANALTTNHEEEMEDQHHEQQDDSQPLWIRSDHRPTEIPPCPYCQAPRAFEFQLMPQMLSFLVQHEKNKKEQQQSSTNAAVTATNGDKNETAKQALMAANSIITNAADPSQIPPSLVDAQAKVMKAFQDQLFQDDGHRVDWGVVAIYTCTKSCGNGIDLPTNADATKETSKLGVYREEFAWVQPALDL